MPRHMTFKIITAHLTDYPPLYPNTTSYFFKPQLKEWIHASPVKESSV